MIGPYPPAPRLRRELIELRVTRPRPRRSGSPDSIGDSQTAGRVENDPCGLPGFFSTGD